MISVGLPVVKTDFFKEALESILNQSYLDFELLVVNNGANPKVKEILSNYDDRRIKYFEHDPILPIIKNWNKVLSYAKGEYFVLFSDDDIYEKDFLKEMVYLSQKFPDIDLFHCRTKVVDEGGNTLYYSSSSPEYESCADFIWHRIKSYRFTFAPDFMVRTQKLRDIGGFYDLPQAWGSDDITWFKIANEKGVVASAKVLCCWRESSVNLATIGKVPSKLSANKNYMVFLNDFLNTELKYTNDEVELVSQIKLNLSAKKSLMDGHALRQVGGNKKIGAIKIIFVWLTYKFKYNLSIASLAWAIALLYKTSNRSR